MKLYLSEWSRDTIGLENKVIDLARLEIRPRVSEEDLEKQYDEFIERLETIKDYFEEQDAFKQAREEALREKRPKLIPRNPRYPSLFNLSQLESNFGFLHPEKRRHNDKYFTAGRCMVNLKDKATELERENFVNPKFQQDLKDKFAQYPGYEGIIEIQNNKTLSEVKSITFHESLHYVIFRYLANTGRRFAVNEKDLSDRDKYICEHMLHERAVVILTDKLLAYDQNALFESRWLYYRMDAVNQGIMAAWGLSMISLGFIAGSVSPYLFSLIFIPGRIEAIARQKYKESKREEVLKPLEHPKFKI